MKTLLSLRKKHPRFVYKSYSYRAVGNNLKIAFDFRVESNIQFKPEIIVKNIPKLRLKKIGERALNNLVFHLGLMEIPSYWKAVCSPEIIVEAGYLNKEQINWWHDLIIKGLGQFFYENKIPFQKPKIVSSGNKHIPVELPLNDRYLVPMGGGKDSIITLEKLKKKKRIGFMVNPTKAACRTAKLAGIKNQIIVERKIDPLLLKLNRRGFLNGHTPFTAVLSFLSVFCAVLFDCKHIAFSNEKSANEGNVKYLGRVINHQWSKSSEFEKNFKKYCKKYLAKNINYFSFLRKYTELEIAKMFSRYPKYFPAFCSCNIGIKIGERWCGNCPKCLFVYVALYPFLEKKQLLKIFGQDLFDPSTSSGREKLLLIMRSLLGQGRHKPFECVGTFKESRLAFKLCLKKAQKSGQTPWLLTNILRGV